MTRTLSASSDRVYRSSAAGDEDRIPRLPIQGPRMERSVEDEQ